MANLIVFVLASLLGAYSSHRYPSGGEQQLLDIESEDMELAPREANIAPSWPLTFYFENRQESLPVSLFPDDRGELSADALAVLTHHVRCYRTDRERAIDPRLAEIVARVAEAFARDRVDVISGFRARPYGAPHSKHFLGRAMDLHLPGVPSKKVAAWVWKNFRGVGVGYYPKQDFVHIDVRDLDVRWIDTSTHGESAHARYFARLPSEAVSADAPRLAYDHPREVHDVVALKPIAHRLEERIASLALGFRGPE